MLLVEIIVNLGILVLSFTKHIQQLIIKVNQEIVFKVTKTSKKSSDRKGQFNMNSIHNFFKMTQLTESEQTFSIENGPSIKLNHISVECNVIIDEQYHQQIRRILKKSLPPSIQIQLLYHSDNVKIKFSFSLSISFSKLLILFRF